MSKKELSKSEIHKRFNADVAKEILKLMALDPPFRVIDGGHYVQIFCPCPVDAKPTNISNSKSRSSLHRVRRAAANCPEHPELKH